MALTLPQPCLCLVTDRRLAPGAELPRRVAAAVAGGVNLAQLREKDLPGGELLVLARELAQAVAGRAPLLVNERVDVAHASGAAGAQLGEAALPASAARRILGPDALIGRSVHSLDGALRAEQDGADFLLAGTMFASASHPGEEPSGPGLVARIEARCALPVIGIGGITAANAAAVMAAGASGVAVISAILAAADPRAAAGEIWRVIGGSPDGSTPSVTPEEDLVHRD